MDNQDFLRDDNERNLWLSITESGWQYYVWVFFLLSVIACGLYAYSLQLRYGLSVTGLSDQNSWGLYISNFVFFIGISHAGTLISSILRLTHANWRQPVTRLAEAITVASLMVGGILPLIDMGRPDRVVNILIFGRVQSNLMWDMIGISTYLTGSLMFFWMMAIPDIAFLRNHYPNPGLIRRTIYRVLAVEYNDNRAQYGYLEKANHIMTIVILPLAVSVHTVVAWIFAMTLRPGWQSTILGPYFVVGAIFSGIAAAILAMYVFRRVYRLEGYIKPDHFCYLGYLLLTLTLTYLYFNVNEYLTSGYKMAEHEKGLLDMLFKGEFAWMFWGAQIFSVLVPAFILSFVLGIKWLRDRYAIPGTVIASILVIIGAWIKRYLIVVATLSNPFLPGQNLPAKWTHYTPTWVEWAILAAFFAGFFLIYTILSKLFPIVSIWETREVANGTRTGTSDLGSSPSSTLKKVTPILVAFLLINSFAEAKENGAKNKLPRSSVVSLSSSRTGEPPRATVTITATIKDGKKNTPIPDVPIRFEMKTLFGALKLGSVPTDDKGQATLVLRDKRLGSYSVKAIFKGDDEYEASEAQFDVDFGEKPPPRLSEKGILITPYPTFISIFPLAAFYGSCWVVFVIVLGRFILWKMRRA